MCRLLIIFSKLHKIDHSSGYIAGKMVELRVTIDEKLNKLVESGICQSKAELMRSATIYLLIQMSVIKEHIQNESLPRKKNSP
jgi:Arc/MetJ-type ribon-helix-helix transcriptional regulator